MLDYDAKFNGMREVKFVEGSNVPLRMRTGQGARETGVGTNMI